MIIKNASIYTENHTFVNGNAVVENGRFVSFSDFSEQDAQIVDAQGLYMIPGLVDIHFHGCMGADMCDGTKEALDIITRYEASIGVTSVCPATMTIAKDELLNVMKNAGDYAYNGGAHLVGINMEGPFISASKKGAQAEENILHCDYEYFCRLQKAAKGLIKLVDLAPEEPGAMEFIEKAKDEVVISLAHTASDYDTAKEAIQRGASHATHLYNAMPPLNHRNPGVIGAVRDSETMTTLLSTGFVTTIMPSIADSATKTLAFDKIANPFIGILAGIIGSMCYNRFKNTKLPDWLAFFSGKRCVAIIAGVVSILASVVLLFVWPLLFGALVALGKGIVGLDVVGAGIYAFLNRLLIPTGLHHALNNVFWFDTIGLGDLQHFWAGETSADVSWSLGMYMSGFFPCMMFGIPGAALAMVKCAKPAKKKVAIGLVASAAICAFICGVTEPFEFGFMFLAPVLYVIYAALYGIFTMITVALGFRAGFSFSAGAMDLFFSASLPAAAKTWLIIPLGIAAFLVFYFVFLFAIKKFDLKTPGREDDDDLEAEKNVELASDDFTAIAAKILEGCGGKENIASIDNCVTRLRLEVKDMTAVNDKVIKSAGVAGVIRPGKTSVQVIVGTKVQFVADAFSRLCE